MYSCSIGLGEEYIEIQVVCHRKCGLQHICSLKNVSHVKALHAYITSDVLFVAFLGYI